MAFDMGFDFRASVGYVTDPAYGVFVHSTHAYPHTFTAGNGYSINAGWDSAPTSVDGASGNDPRIAGYQYINPGTVQTFTLDLSSGSAPGAGTYTLDLAAGAATGGTLHNYITVKDNTTALITITNAVTTAGQFADATGAVIAATATWIGATLNKMFASTVCKVEMNTGSPGSYSALAHFRLTLAAAAAFKSAWAARSNVLALAGSPN